MNDWHFVVDRAVGHQYHMLLLDSATNGVIISPSQ